MQIDYTDKQPKTLLNKGTGFLAGYSHSLNPYTGCAFGCSYCYVRKMPVSLFRGKEWGTWVDIKKQSAALLQKELIREKKKGPVTIFMSSSTDPYQQIEYKEEITRSLLEVMTGYPPDFLLVQTRSPLVKRDIDLLKQLGTHVRVSMTVETDLDDVRKHFSPSAPPVQARLNALQRLREEGIPTQVAIAPVLPSSEAFPELLRPVVDLVCIDDFFMGDGAQGKRTQQLGIRAKYEELGFSDWYNREAYKVVVSRMLEVFPEDRVRISQEGFAPF
ncbi:radical SAM protein [Paenibacillus sp. Marseille-Q4541]|uniref:SPL family radical SAM protein n=1 Tax=Paenibacillus sp. Marseille-Q4541 TaxID=2831522 RepID=UPI001BA7BB98|nr:radical SAM protein [Paenibacillus sp. Marseille-Q4541]